MDVDTTQLPIWVQVLSLIVTGGGVYFGVWWKNRGNVQQVVDSSIRTHIEGQDAKIARLEHAVDTADARIEELQRTTRQVLASLGLIEAQASSIKLHLQAYLATVETAPDLAAEALERVELGFDGLHRLIQGLREDTDSRQEIDA